MDKVILFSRVSTQRQDLTQQTDALRKEARHLGFRDRQMVVIEYKESAIKLDEDDRRGLQELKHAISSDPACRTVLVYEISRLSRQLGMLMNIRDWLVERGVQLICMKPPFRLLQDGKMSTEAIMMFSMFAALSETEMIIKKERIARGQAAKKASGEFTGGGLLLGYTTTGRRGKIQVDKKQAEVVTRIFEMYARGQSMTSIAREMRATGELNCKTLNSARTMVWNMLRRREYLGHGGTRDYPALISQDLWDRVQERLQEGHRHPKTASTYQCLCRGMIRHYPDGVKMMVRGSKHAYQWTNLDKGNEYVSARLVDSVVWHAVREWATNTMTLTEMAAQARERERELARKQRQAELAAQEAERRMQRIEERYIMGRISREKADRMHDDCVREIREADAEQLRLDAELTNVVVSMRGMTRDWSLVTDFSERERIVHESVREIWLEHVGEARRRIWMTMRDGRRFECIAVTLGCKPTYYALDGAQIDVELLKRV